MKLYPFIASLKVFFFPQQEDGKYLFYTTICTYPLVRLGGCPITLALYLRCD